MHKQSEEGEVGMGSCMGACVAARVRVAKLCVSACAGGEEQEAAKS